MLQKQTLVRKANGYPQSTLLWMAGRAPLAKRAEIGVQKARQNVQHAFANVHRCPKLCLYKFQKRYVTNTFHLNVVRA
jgi:hypothetical protein